MNRMVRSMLVALAFHAVLATGAFGQYSERIADSFGIGPAGTIGRGTDLLPGGPSDPRTGGRYSLFGAAGPVYGPLGARYGGSTVYQASPYAYPAPAPRLAGAPYLTKQFYEPGDGYRYPLYYNPSTGVYFYYPVKK